MGLVGSKICQVTYLVDGLVRFDSVGPQTPRGHSPHTPEHIWKALQGRISEDRFCVSWCDRKISLSHVGNAGDQGRVEDRRVSFPYTSLMCQDT